MSNIVRKHVPMHVEFSKLVLSMTLANSSKIIKSFCRKAFTERSILTSYCSSEIPTTVPFPALPKTALWWGFLRFPPRLASLDSRRKGNGETRGGRKIDFNHLLHDKLTGCTWGVVCQLFYKVAGSISKPRAPAGFTGGSPFSICSE